PGREGKDARVVMIDKKQKEDPDEDYNFIESVTAGEVVAYKEPPQPGEKGKDVFGNVIEPLAVKDVELVAGDDVKISPDGMRAIAAAPGTPSLSCHKNKACISIVPTYIVKGDIGKETGNIMYKGNLVVRGNIDDNFDLKIGNNIKVGKSIANTQIVAGGDIYIKRNIISSEINAGGYFDRDLLATIDEMVREINKLLKAIEEIFGAAKKYGNRDELKMGKVLRLLLNDKFRTLMSHLKELSHDLEEVNIPAIMKKECHQLLNKIVGYKKILQIKDTDVFCQLKELLSDILKEGQKKSHSSNVYADYVQNSVIKAAGNVLIKAKGCYNSQIMAGGNIAISGKKGYLRGGNYRAEGSIYVRNVGGGFSTTEVYVEERFYAAEVKGNLIIRTLNDVVKISGSKNNVNLRVNNEGRLKSAAGKPDFQKLKNRMTG
ncbi:MAG: FapA family protein, partial [Halanaerobiaceae bacterium]